MLHAWVTTLGTAGRGTPASRRGRAKHRGWCGAWGPSGDRRGGRGVLGPAGEPQEQAGPRGPHGGSRMGAPLLPPCAAHREPLASLRCPNFRGHSALASSHAGSLVSSEPGNPLRHGATAGCGRRGACERGAEPKPSRRGGIAAFPLPFELRQPPGAAVPPSTDRGAGEAAGSSGERGSQAARSCTGAARRGQQELGGRWAHAGAIPGETGGKG